ncbi:hypothetical protein NDA14_001885 [Ustilago hordei]|nr:hypothetical protein NDA12_001909 [Ustilago hordei]KAJ1576113.1 hypothetical protein NDA15_001870 [Ustilago hordei]KAJ1595333.1 hypothetical protein NDA14_001885 [Ustilago hordei]
MPPDSAANLLLSLLTGPPPPPQPNTLCKLPIFNEANFPASVGSLQLCIWLQFLAFYPNQAFADQLCGALCHSAKLSYEGPLCSATRLNIPNLPLDNHNIFHLHQEITAHLWESHLWEVPHPQVTGLICSPLGVIPKPNSNNGIQPSYVAIHYDNLDAIMDFIHKHPSTSLWKADLEDAFQHVIVAESDMHPMGIHFDSVYYQECTLAFGARSLPFLFNLFAKFLHWLVTFALQLVTAHSPLSHSGVSHYLNNFFGASDTTTDPATPVQLLSLTATALGFKISAKKTWWAATRLEILGIELDMVAQMASITAPCCQHILQLCLHIVAHGCTSLLELQQVAGHLQFVTCVAPHGCAFLCHIYDVVQAHFKAPFSHCISKNMQAELLWWVATLTSWDSVSLLQPSPLMVEHIWTDASKCSIGAHLGCMDSPSAAFSHELPCCHQWKDNHFLEALAVLEALCQFSPLWTGHHRVVIHIDNKNVEYSLHKGSICDPQTQVLFWEIFALCLHLHIDLVLAASLLWSGLTHTTCAHSTTVYNNFSTFAASLCITNPLLALPNMLIEWVTHHHASNKSLNTIKWDFYMLKSWHIDLGLPIKAFNSPRLNSFALSPQSAPPSITATCSVPPSASPSPASFGQVNSHGRPLDPTPLLCLPSPSLLTTCTQPSCCWPARQTLFGKVPPSLCLLFPSAPVQWPASSSFVTTAPCRSPSLCLRVASPSVVAPSSPCSGTAWGPAGWCCPHTQAILSDEVLPHGQQPMGLMPTLSAPLATGAVIASDTMLIGLQQSMLPPPGWPSTQTPLLSYTSTSQPGRICSLTFSLGSPASMPQPQLVTVTPYSMPLAYSVAMAGSSPATLPRVRQSHISHVSSPACGACTWQPNTETGNTKSGFRRAAAYNGLKQADRLWHAALDGQLQAFGFK